MLIKNNTVIKSTYIKCVTTFIAFIVVSSYNLYAQKAAGAPTQELAKVAIMSYDDKTGTKNFAYMSGSLADAVDTSLKKNFQYKRIRSGKVKLAQNKANLTMKNASDIKKMKSIAQSTRADIIVFGAYVFDEKTKELVITTKVYLAGADNIRTLPVTRNVVDNTIFKATAIVAGTLVSEINIMIADLKRKRGEKIDEKQAKGKKKLTKDLSGDKYSWYSKKEGKGVSIMKTFEPDNTENAVRISFHIRKKIKNRLFTALSLDGILLSKFVDYASQTVETTFWALSVTATVGYMIPVKRFNFFGEIGGGYFYGANEAIFPSAGGETIEDPAYNAIATIRLGAEYLLTPRISVGLITDYTMYYDNVSPIHTLSSGVVFRSVY